MQTIKNYEELPLVLSVMDVAHIIGISKNTAYDLVRSGQIRSIHVGRQIRITKDAVTDYLNGAS